ncbi:MAG: hypothetical protein ABJQ29_04685 [Luteolibacter sp.]
MKRTRIFLPFICLMAFGLAIWLLPIAFQKIRATPLEGHFGSIICACGHEIFYELHGSDAYETCPAHRERKHLGKVIRTPNAATVISSKTGKPDLVFTYDGSQHRCDFLYSGSSPNIIDQVNNPWRTILPKYLPESW